MPWNFGMLFGAAIAVFFLGLMLFGLVRAVWISFGKEILVSDETGITLERKLGFLPVSRRAVYRRSDITNVSIYERTVRRKGRRTTIRGVCVEGTGWSARTRINMSLPDAIAVLHGPLGSFARS